MITRDLMTANPVTVGPKATIADVWELMREMEIRHVPVVSDRGLVGMVSDRDLGRLDLTRAVSGTGAPGEELGVSITEVMSPDVIAIEPETELAEVLDLFLEHKIGALPVVEPDTREVVGILSYVDVLRGLRDLLDED